MELAFAHAAIAEDAECGPVLAAHVGGETEAGGDGHVARDNGVAAEEAATGIEDVHRAAASLVRTADASE